MNETIYQIKGIKLQELKWMSPLELWFNEMVRKRVEDLTLGDISRMLRQEIYLDIAVPCAYGRLRDNPFCGEMYDGQLLELLLRVLQNHPQERDIGFCRGFFMKAREELERYEWGSDDDKAVYLEWLEAFSRWA